MRITHALNFALCLQELYEAVPIALAPVLGNPIALAAAGVDRSLSLQDQVGCAAVIGMHLASRGHFNLLALT
jgi:hypothetical protein